MTPTNVKYNVSHRFSANDYGEEIVPNYFVKLTFAAEGRHSSLFLGTERIFESRDHHNWLWTMAIIVKNLHKWDNLVTLRFY